jgi:hypothetical protein
MGFSQIQLLDENGGLREEVIDERNQLVCLVESVPNLEATHCLQYLDPYGDTVLNTLQMPRFLAEWRMCEEQAHLPEVKSLATQIRRLASICEKEPHLYLKFIGD